MRERQREEVIDSVRVRAREGEREKERKRGRKKDTLLKPN